MASRPVPSCPKVHIAAFGLGVFHIQGPMAHVRVVLPGFGRAEKNVVVVTTPNSEEINRFYDVGYCLKWCVGYCGGTRSDALLAEETLQKSLL